MLKLLAGFNTIAFNTQSSTLSTTPIILLFCWFSAHIKTCSGPKPVQRVQTACHFTTCLVSRFSCSAYPGHDKVNIAYLSHTVVTSFGSFGSDGLACTLVVRRDRNFMFFCWLGSILARLGCDPGCEPAAARTSFIPWCQFSVSIARDRSVGLVVFIFKYRRHLLPILL